MNKTRDDAERINETSLRLLEDPGVRIEHDEILAMLLKAGAGPGGAANVARFPRDMVRDFVARAPKVVRFAARDGSVVEVRAGDPSRFWTGAALSYIGLDGSYREITSADLAEYARLIDRLGSVDAIVGTAMSDVPPAARDFVGLRVMAENTRKHLRALSFTPRGAEAMKEMGRVLAAGPLRDRPVFSMGFTAHGPLRWTNLALDIFLRSAGEGIPVTVNGEPSAGASGPVTLAGSLAVGNAEVLAGIVINQVIEPGRPVLHNLGFSHYMDMKTTAIVTGGAETCLMAAMGAEIARLWGLPSVSWMCTESMSPDEQAAAESTMAALAHGSARVSVVWGVGSLESEKAISPVKAVMDDEIIAMARRFLRDIDVNDDTLAENVTREVGIAGDFLGTEHTLAHFRSEFFEPRVLWRHNRQRWQDARSPRMSDRARDRARLLLDSDRPPTIDADAARELRKIEARYLRE